MAGGVEHEEVTSYGGPSTRGGEFYSWFGVWWRVNTVVKGSASSAAGCVLEFMESVLKANEKRVEIVYIREWVLKGEDCLPLGAGN